MTINNFINVNSMKTENWKLKIGTGWRKIIIFFLLIALVATTIIFFPHHTPTAEAAWYGNGWAYRQKLTITNSGSELTDYQVILDSSSISMTDIFAHSQESGADLRFSTSDGSTNIPYWIENYSVSGASAKVYIKVPTIAASGTTDIYIYYGNATVETASSKVNTFIREVSGLEGSWNFDESSGTTAFDSSGIGNDGTLEGSPSRVSGKFLNALSFDTNNRKVSIPTNAAYDFTTPLTLEAWVKTSSCGWNWIMARSGWLYGFGNSSSCKLVWTVSGGNDKISTGTLNDNVWHHAVATHDGTNMRLYLDGTEVGDFTGVSVGASTSPIYVGTLLSGSSEFWSGIIDEVKIYNATLTPDEISDIKNNYGYTTPNNPNKVLVKKYATTEPTVALNGSQEIGDTIAPSNPTSITGKDESGGSHTLDPANYYNYTKPYFEWPAAEAEGGAHDTGENFVSGVAGYYSYFGTSCGAGGANPATTKGDYLAEVGGTGVHYSADINMTLATPLTTAGTYCLRIKSKDNAGNLQSTTWEAFVYKFENVSPNAPAYIAASPSGYTATDSYSFSWPASTDVGDAGLAGYQYKRGGSSGDSWSDTQVATSISGIHKYQDGTNVFIVRAVDTAGNYSSEVQTSYYFTASAPSKPTSLTVSPSGTSPTNSFSFSWDAPAHPHNITDYGYSVNAWPTATNITWTGSSATTLAAGPYATQQGLNDFYLVAKDEGGNYALDAANVAQVAFTCDTAAPPAPVMMGLTDTSNRASNIWSLTLKWAAGAGQDEESFDHYIIEKSTDATTYSELATTAGNTYVDATGLNNSTTYYYRLKSVDNAGNISVASQVLSKMPTGKYTTPPLFVDTPSATVKATEATIKWTTSRVSSSSVRYGTSESSLSDNKGDAENVTSHTIVVTGLKSATTYYYQVQSLDDDRDYSPDMAYSSVNSFTTEALPTIANVKISNVTLTSADISWETTVASSSSIAYGTTIDYGESWSDSSDSRITNHTTKIENLQHSTTYHFRVSGSDDDANSFVSDDYVFETQKMPSISNVGYEQDKSGPSPNVVVTWKTNVATSSSIEYKPKDGVALTEESEATLLTDHKITLKGLNDSTEYRFFVSGRDQFGNYVKSDENILQTANDTRAPRISEVIIESSNVGMGMEDTAQVAVSWKTDEPGTSMVEYGEGVGSDNYTKRSVEDKSLATSHLVIIPELQASSPYHLRAVSADATGNVSTGDDNTVVPGEVQKSILSIILQSLKNAFGWMGGI